MTAKLINGKVHLFITDDVAAVEKYSVQPEAIADLPGSIDAVLKLTDSWVDQQRFLVGHAILV